MRQLMIKAAGLLAALPALSYTLQYLIDKRFFLACVMTYLAWLCYSVVVMFLALKLGLGLNRDAEKQQNDK